MAYNNDTAIVRYNSFVNYFPKLAYLIQGDAQFELKGSAYFASKLTQYQAKVLSIKEEYSTKLDEQRNFWGFILALFSVFTFPVIFSTGYW